MLLSSLRHALAHLVGAAWWGSLSTCCRHAVVPLAPCLATCLFSFKGKRSSSCHFSDGIGLTGCQLHATSGFMHVVFLATTSSNTGGWIHVLIVPPHHGWHECFARGAISHGALAHEGLAYEKVSPMMALHMRALLVMALLMVALLMMALLMMHLLRSALLNRAFYICACSGEPCS